MTGIDDLIREITCPTCQTTVDADFPRGSEIVSVTADESMTAGTARETEKRRKQLQKICPRKHLITVVYDW